MVLFRCTVMCMYTLVSIINNTIQSVYLPALLGIGLTIALSHVDDTMPLSNTAANNLYTIYTNVYRDI